ncbi:MAG: DUF342 domain-containing protein [Lachnospiraceae bacterium]|nr:DUF342 domain-containing protein [Lachnospiraceae bacterium]
MSDQNQKGPQIRISFDSMEAFMSLPVPEEEEGYNFDDVMAVAKQKGVRAGIDEELIKHMIDNKIYLQERRIAVGKECVEGKDGYFEFLFNRDFSRAPKILPDGTADYYSMNTIATVAEGDEIAIYHHAVEGKNGFNVGGIPQTCKRVRDLPPLLGKGFTRSEDGDHYTADIAGKIEYVQDRVMISPVYEIQSDIGVQTGNIDFNGDVIIHGMVRTGTSIKATGSVSIDGIVENASITAGKDIILKSGLMGNSQAVVKTKGNLFAKFIEYATLDIKGTINAEVLLNCDVVCGEKLIITGSRGSVVGGTVRAIGGVEANQIGNEMETKTMVAVGAEVEVYRRMKVLEHKVKSTEQAIESINNQIAEIDKKEAAKSVVERPKSDPRKVALLRMKVKEATNLSQDQEEASELGEIIKRAEGAQIVVYGSVYPGTTARIDDIVVNVKDPQQSIKFVKEGDHVHMVRNEDL